MPRSNHQPRKSPSNPWRRRLTLFAALVVLVFCVGLGVGYLKHRSVSPVTPPTAELAPQPHRQILLYFASADGRSLVAQSGDINECHADEECLRATIETLIAGPQPDSGLAAVLPQQVKLRNLTLENSMVSVDFSQDLIAAHPGGTQSELLTVYGLTDTIVVNFPHLRQVRILVEGEPATTLKGHIDLRQPLNPDFSLVEEGQAPIGNMTGSPVGRDE